MNLLDRLGDWLEAHERTEDRVAWLFLLLAAAFVGGHVAVYVI